MNSLKIEQSSGKRSHLAREIVETVILTVVMFFIVNQAVQNYDVEGPSMEPGLHTQERIMVDKVSYRFHNPNRGDVIVFTAPPHPTMNYVKRVIAVPGDTVTIKGTSVIVDGKTLDEPYVSPRYQGNPYPPVLSLVVPSGDYYVLGDDRANSSDSRDWGFVPRKNIIGRAALIYWPLGQDNNGFLPDASPVFAGLR